MRTEVPDMGAKREPRPCRARGLEVGRGKRRWWRRNDVDWRGKRFGWKGGSRWFGQFSNRIGKRRWGRNYFFFSGAGRSSTWKTSASGWAWAIFMAFSVTESLSAFFCLSWWRSQRLAPNAPRERRRTKGSMKEEFFFPPVLRGVFFFLGAMVSNSPDAADCQSWVDGAAGLPPIKRRNIKPVDQARKSVPALQPSVLGPAFARPTARHGSRSTFNSFAAGYPCCGDINKHRARSGARPSSTFC